MKKIASFVANISASVWPRFIPLSLRGRAKLRATRQNLHRRSTLEAAPLTPPSAGGSGRRRPTPGITPFLALLLTAALLCRAYICRHNCQSRHGEDQRANLQIHLRPVRRAPGQIDLRRTLGRDAQRPQILLRCHRQIRSLGHRQRHELEIRPIPIPQSIAVESHRPGWNRDDGKRERLRRRSFSPDPSPRRRLRSRYFPGRPRRPGRQKISRIYLSSRQT